MAQPLDFSALLSDPAFAEEFKKGYAKGEAIAQTVATTPMQPPVEGIEEQPEMPIPSSSRDMQKQMYALLQKSMGQQQAQVEQLKAAAEKEKQRQEQMGVLGRLDLRPFAEALKGYGATGVAVPKEAPEDRTEILRKLQAAVSDAEQGLTKEQVAFMKNIMDNKKSAQEDISKENQKLRIRTAINTSEQAKKIRNIGTLNQKLQGLESLVAKYGAEISGDEKAKLDSAFRDAEVAWKEAANLGALQGPDIEMIRGALGESPTTLKGIGRYGLSGGKEGLLAKIRGARQRAVDEGTLHYSNLQTIFPYEVAEPIFSDFQKKLTLTPMERAMSAPEKAGAAPVQKAKVTPKDVKSMTKEQLKKYLGE
jgi:hypothetical protein